LSEKLNNSNRSSGGYDFQYHLSFIYETFGLIKIFLKFHTMGLSPWQEIIRWNYIHFMHKADVTQHYTPAFKNVGVLCYSAVVCPFNFVQLLLNLRREFNKKEIRILQGECCPANFEGVMALMTVY
jgi:hypothetical protein